MTRTLPVSSTGADNSDADFDEPPQTLEAIAAFLYQRCLECIVGVQRDKPAATYAELLESCVEALCDKDRYSPYEVYRVFSSAWLAAQKISRGEEPE